MRIDIRNETDPVSTYRAERVRSLFNATDDQASVFTLGIDAPGLEPDGDWSIGVVVGPSGSGKSSIGKMFWGPEYFEPEVDWGTGPIVDAIATGGDFNAVTAALASAGLGDVPAWLRPYSVLSTGQKFRADLARVIAEAPERVVLDEFTSVVDRQIARIGAGAFAKAWRRTGGRALILTCHYDVLDWLEPDWVIDTATGTYERADDSKEGKRWSRPRFDLEIRVGGWELWQLFKPHHYLDIPNMVGARCYVGFVDGEPVSHLGVATKNVPIRRGGRSLQAVEARASRMVVFPEWQGAGVGMRMLNEVCRLQLVGEGVLPGRRMTTQFHTSHPQLAFALRRSPYWRQISGGLAGANRGASAKSLAKSGAIGGTTLSGDATGFGGHLRAVQGFRYYGEAAAK